MNSSMPACSPSASDPRPRLPAEYRSSSPADTCALASLVAGRLRPGDVLALHGDLGAGKTCFVQGLGAALRVREPVHSPTFTLINEYHGALPLYHVDLYRLAGSAEALDLGLDEYLDGDGVTVIEWAERAGSALPPRTIHIEFRPGGSEEERDIRILEPEGA